MTKPRAWELKTVSTDVYCTSTGHYFFRCHLRHHEDRVAVWYCSDGNIDGPRLPKYMVQAIEDKIGFMQPGAFQVYEKDRDGNERHGMYRYHDPEHFKKIVFDLYPQPF